jgi:hypothetical protein
MRTNLARHSRTAPVAHVDPARTRIIAIRSIEEPEAPLPLLWWRWWLNTMRSVMNPLELKERTFVVEVESDEDGYTAVCPEIGLITEAENWDALVERACLVAPEIAEENGFVLNRLVLDFHLLQTVD